MLCGHGNTSPCVECDMEPLKAQNEALRARVAQLEMAVLNAIQLMPGGQAKADLRDVYDEEHSAEAFILRKQAEAVDVWANDQHLPPDEDLTELGWHAKRIYQRARDHAQRLRQQANEIEND